MGLWLHAVSASVRRAHCSHSPLHSNFLLVGSFSPGRARGRMSSSSQRTLPLAMEAYYEYPFEQKVSPSAERCGFCLFRLLAACCLLFPVVIVAKSCRTGALCVR